MNKLHGAAAALAIALPSSLVLPAHAADPCAMGGYSFSAISTSGFSCQKGDKIYSDFSFSGSGFNAGSFTFSDVPSMSLHQFGASGLTFTMGTSGTYSYKVAIDTTISPNRRISSFQTSSTTFGASQNITKTLTDGTFTVTSTNGSTSVEQTYDPLNPGPISFSSQITSTSGLLSNFTDTISQADYVPPVPGPFPLLGAAAAFNVSRQLRKRSKQLV
jgi:hypothetical protein